MEWVKGDFRLSDDPGELDLAAVVAMLHGTYWAHDRSEARLRAAFANSFCLHLKKGPAQVGFARAVTDYATFTWVCDVIVDPGHRGQGLGKWLVECLIRHPKLQTAQLLGTKDAHALYERYGFKRLEFMKRLPPGVPIGYDPLGQSKERQESLFPE